MDGLLMSAYGVVRSADGVVLGADMGSADGLVVNAVEVVMLLITDQIINAHDLVL